MSKKEDESLLKSRKLCYTEKRPGTPREGMLVGQETFTAGVGPGGLRTKNDIRVLVCYLLSSVDAPLSEADILSILQGYDLANYFEIMDVLSDLLKKGLIVRPQGQPDCVQAAPAGKEVSAQLDMTLPLSVREKTVAAAVNLLARARREQENRVEIKKNERGYSVTCHVSDREMDLLTFTLYAPDLYQARLIKKNFHREPGMVYRAVLAAVTGSRELAADALRRIIP